MRFAPIFSLFALFAIFFQSPAYAITNGSTDGTDHPSVAALISDRPYGDGTWAYCTGTLISPTVLVTAAHCGKKGQRAARVSFAPHYRQGDTVYAGRYIPDPRYRPDRDLHDIAVVVFGSPIPNVTPARLPAANALTRMKADGTLQDATFTPVGYGALAPAKGSHGEKERFLYTDTRTETTISYEGLTHAWLKLAADGAKHDGGTCYGDSGGPNFLGDSDLLVATTISGDDDACKSTNYDYRLDTAPARNFLRRFVRLP